MYGYSCVPYGHVIYNSTSNTGNHKPQEIEIDKDPIYYTYNHMYGIPSIYFMTFSSLEFLHGGNIQYDQISSSIIHENNSLLFIHFEFNDNTIIGFYFNCVPTEFSENFDEIFLFLFGNNYSIDDINNISYIYSINSPESLIWTYNIGNSPKYSTFPNLQYETLLESPDETSFIPFSNNNNWYSFNICKDELNLPTITNIPHCSETYILYNMKKSLLEYSIDNNYYNNVMFCYTNENEQDIVIDLTKNFSF